MRSLLGLLLAACLVLPSIASPAAHSRVRRQPPRCNLESRCNGDMDCPRNGYDQCRPYGGVFYCCGEGWDGWGRRG
ncbi:hypothetical protein AAVH_06322 [Aphelenchoides avenae]|nr:hypothetical protein AAVH_06322 [Aphelenchus avenae]